MLRRTLRFLGGGHGDHGMPTTKEAAHLTPEWVMSRPVPPPPGRDHRYAKFTYPGVTTKFQFNIPQQHETKIVGLRGHRDSHETTAKTRLSERSIDAVISGVAADVSPAPRSPADLVVDDGPREVKQPSVMSIKEHMQCDVNECNAYLDKRGGELAFRRVDYNPLGHQREFFPWREKDSCNEQAVLHVKKVQERESATPWTARGWSETERGSGSVEGGPLRAEVECLSGIHSTHLLLAFPSAYDLLCVSRFLILNPFLDGFTLLSSSLSSLFFSVLATRFCRTPTLSLFFASRPAIGLFSHCYAHSFYLQTLYIYIELHIIIIFTRSMNLIGVLLLVALAAQNCVATVLIRYAKKNVEPSKQFHNGSLVLVTEVVKLMLSFTIAGFQSRRCSGEGPGPRSTSLLIGGRLSVRQTVRRAANAAWYIVDIRWLRRVTAQVWTADMWRLLIPSFLYTVQSILGFRALNTLDPATYQCFSQIRLVFTTCFSVAMLGRVVLPLQWIALIAMTTGLAFLHLGRSEDTRGWRVRRRSQRVRNEHDARMASMQWYGIMCVMASCLATSYASVYLEWVMTSLQSATVAVRNIQLSIFGIVFSLVCLYFLDIRQNWDAQARAIANRSCYIATVDYDVLTPRNQSVPYGCVEPFYIWERFDRWSTWSVVFIQAIGGLLIGFTMAYSDSVVKCLATGLSTVASAGIAYVKHDFDYSWLSFVGSIMAIASSYIFNVTDREQKRKRS
eukprot:gene12535-8588_t